MKLLPPLPTAQEPSTYAINHSALTFQLITLALLGGGTGLLTGLYCFNDTPLALSLKMIFAAILLLSTRRWMGTVLLIFIQVDLFVNEPRQAGFHPVTTLLFCVLVVALLMFVSRYRALRQTSVLRFMELLRRIWFASPVSSGPAGAVTESASPAALSAVMLTGMTLLWTGVRILAACVVAVALGAEIPSPQNADAWLTQSDSGALYLWPGPAILAGVVGLLLVISEISWRQHTIAQSRLYLRSVFLKLSHRDLRMLIRRQLAAKNRAAPPSATQADPRTRTYATTRSGHSKKADPHT